MTIYSGFSHWKWWFFIVMLVYQRVCSKGDSTSNIHQPLKLRFSPRWSIIFDAYVWFMGWVECTGNGMFWSSMIMTGQSMIWMETFRCGLSIARWKTAILKTNTHICIYIYIIIHFNIMFSDFLAFNGLPISKLIHCDLILKSFLITRRCHHGFHGNLAWFASNHRPNIFLWLSRNNSDLIIWFHNHVYIYMYMYSRLLSF